MAQKICWLVAGLALVGLTACQTPVQVDRLEDMSFTHYEDFAFAPDLAFGDDPAFGPSARSAANRILVRELESLGLAEVPRDEADVLLAVGVSTERRVTGGGRAAVPVAPQVHTRETRVAGIPVQRETVVAPGGVAEVETPSERVFCTVVVDAFEARTQEHLWRGSTRCRRHTRGIDVDDLEDRIEAIAERLRSD